MREYTIFKYLCIKPHNIVYAATTKPDYEMERLILLVDMPETNYGEYVLVEGSHCSCYDFDDTKWEATVYTREELKKLLENVDIEVDPLRAKLKNFIKLNL